MSLSTQIKAYLGVMNIPSWFSILSLNTKIRILFAKCEDLYTFSTYNVPICPKSPQKSTILVYNSSFFTEWGIQKLAFGIQFLAFRLGMVIFIKNMWAVKPLRGLTMDENLIGVYRYQIRYNSNSMSLSTQIRAYCASGNISTTYTPHIYRQVGQCLGIIWIICRSKSAR